MIKFLKEVVIVLTLCIVSMHGFSQNYYWVGGTGNWSDLAHWSNESGGTGSIYTSLPSANSRVIFDNNSFTLTGETVTFDVNSASIKSMKWSTTTLMPRFEGVLMDSLTINGSLFLDNQMDYAFQGKLVFTKGQMDTLFTASKTILNDIYITNFDTLFVFADDFNSIAGINYLRGGWKASNRVITAKYLKSKKSNARRILVDNAIFNLVGSDTALYINPTSLTRVGTNEVFNIQNASSDTVSLYLGKLDIMWNKLNLENENTYFISKCFFDTIESTTSKSIGLSYNDTLMTNNFLVNGTCGNYVNLYCSFGNAKISGNGNPVVATYLTLKNIVGVTGNTYTASNSLDFGGNTNWTITEDPGVNTYYWVGNSGTFYDASNWSIASGGAPGSCYPGPNDIAIFDANSSGIDTLYINSPIIIGTLNFQSVPNTLVLFGNSGNNVEVRADLMGSSLLQFDWQGEILLTGQTGVNTITSNGLSWGSNMTKIGSGEIQFADAYSSFKDFLLENGTLNSNAMDVNFFNFYANEGVNTRDIDFTGSVVQVFGTNYEIDLTTLIGSYAVPAELKFVNVNGDYVQFISGNYVYNIVRFQTANVDVTVDYTTPIANYSLFAVDAGSTVILQNGSSHLCDSILMNGDCVNSITLKTSSTAGPSATISHNGNVTTQVNNVIIDNVDTDAVGSYYAISSTLLNGSTGWTSTGEFQTMVVNFGSASLTNGANTTLVGNLTGFSPAAVFSSILDLNGISTTASSDLDTVTYELTSSIADPFVAMDSLTGSGVQSGVNFSFPTSTPTGDATLNLILNNLNDSGDFNLTDATLTITYLETAPAITGNTFYWVGNAGNWSDTSHWSLSSGGPGGIIGGVTCAPSFADNVIFDNNSFSAASQTVLVDKEVYINSMSWILTDPDAATLMMSKSMTFSGNVTLNDQVFLTRDNKVSKLVFQPNSTSNLDATASVIDVPLVLLSSDGTGVLDFNSDINMTDSSIVIVGGGVLNTNDNNLSTGTLYFGSDIVKDVNLGTSTINLRYGLNDENVANSLNLDAILSTININYDNGVDSILDNYFISKGHDFNNVTLNFNFANYSWLKGVNNFVNLTIGKGSKIIVPASDEINVSNTLTMVGNCLDSIFMKSDTPGTSYVINNPTNATTVECVNITDANSTGLDITTLYSTLTNTQGAFIEDNVSQAAQAMITGISNYCLGDTLQFLSSSTSVSGTPTLVWDFDDGSSHNGDTTLHYYYDAGEYSLSVTATNANYCSDTYDTLISILNPNVLLTSSLVLDTTICLGESVTFVATPDTSAYSYQFYINSTLSVANDTLVTNSLSDLDTVFAIVFQDLCPAKSNSFVFKVNPLPVTSLVTNNSDIICAGDEVILTASTGTSYQFYKNNAPYTPYGGAILTINDVIDADSYFANVRIDSTGCKANTDTITFTVNPLPTLTIDDNEPLTNTICVGDNVQIISTVGIPAEADTYNYILNGTGISSSTSSTFDIDTLNDGDVITVVTTDINGCVSDTSNQIQYVVNPIPTITVISDTNNFCEGLTATITASGASEYEFSINGDVVQSLQGTDYYLSGTLSNLDEITVYGESNGCPNTSAPLVMNVTPSPLTTLSSNIGTVICSSQTPIFEANSALATSYEFLVNGTVVQSNSTSNTFTPASSLLNGANVTVVGYQGACSASSSLLMTINSSPDPSIYTNDSDNAICESGSLTVTTTGGANYEYFINGDSQGSSASPTLSLTGSALIPGSNEVYAVATAGNLCSTNTDTLEIVMTSLPVVSLSGSAIANTICQGDEITFTATAGADQYQFFLNGISLGLPNSNNEYTTTSLGDGSLITVVGYNGNCSNPGLNSVTVTVNPIPVANIQGPNSFCQGSAITLEAEQGSLYEFIIDGSSLGFSADSILDVSTLSAGLHTIGVNVKDGGCDAYSSSNVTVIALPTVSLNGNTSVCSGTQAVFTASGANQYMFLVNNIDVNGGFFPNPNFSAMLNNNDVVSVVGLNMASCESTNLAQVTVNVNTTPTVTLVSDDDLGDNILCVGDVINFTASGATDYEFFINGVSTPANNDVLTTSGLLNGQSVSVVGTSNGCSDSAMEGPFLISNYPVVSLQNNDGDILCVDELTNLTASGASNYLYYVNGQPQGAFTSNPNLNVLLNNGDVVTVEGSTNNCPTMAPTSITYQVYNYPTTSFVSSAASTSNVICYGDQVTLTGSGAMEYEYFLDGISYPSPSGNLVLDNIENGQVLSLVGYNSHCAAQASPDITFTVNTMDLQMTTSPSNAMICSGDDLQITATGADNYSIYINGNSPSINSTTGNFSLSGLVQGDYIIMTGTSLTTGCTQTDDQTIYAQVNGPVLYAIDGELSFCEGDSVILTSNQPYGNQWLLNGSPIVGATDSTYIVFANGDYSLQTTFGGTGELWSFGYNANGELGNGFNFNSNTPIEALSLTDLNEVKTGFAHVLALDNTGTVFSWGDNSSGQLGNGTYTASNMPASVIAVPVAVSVDAGNDFSAAVSSTGSLFTWGGNNFGQLGLNNTNVYSTPQLVTGLNNLTQVACGSRHILVLKNDGTVLSAGDNSFGQLGMGTVTNSSVFNAVPGLSNIVNVFAGDYHSMAIDNLGNLYVWGNNVSGQLGLNDFDNRLSPEMSPLKNVESCSGGNAHSVMLTSSNRAYTAGANDFGQLGTGDIVDRDSPTLISNIDGVEEVIAGSYHTLFRKIDGSVWGTGRNDNFQLGSLPLGSIIDVERITDVMGVTSMGAGTENSHFIYGTSNNCLSDISTINVSSAPLPVIVNLGNTLVISATGVSYQWYINGTEIVNSNSQSINLSATGYYTVTVTYANGCERTSAPFAYGIVGLEETGSNTVIIYPNPVVNIVTLEGEQLLVIDKIIITDMQGRVVLESATMNKKDSKVTIDMSSYEDGVYHVQLLDEFGGTSLHKLIKN